MIGRNVTVLRVGRSRLARSGDCVVMHWLHDETLGSVHICDSLPATVVVNRAFTAETSGLKWHA